MVDFACIYEQFDPAVPLGPGDSTYVDWQKEVPGITDVKRQLANSILLTPNMHVHRLFTGHRGGGKTTELKRVAEYLRTRPIGSRYFVSFLDAEDTINLDDADATDLVIAIVRQLVTDLRAEGIDPPAGPKLKGFIESVREMFKGIPDSGVDLKAGDPWGIVQLSTSLKRQPSLRRQVRALLEGRLSSLYDGINEELLPGIVDKLQAKGYHGVAVIVDQLDRVPADGDRHHKLFFEGRGKLKALRCNIIYTAPIEYAYSQALPMLENEYNALLGLPLLPVSAMQEDVSREARSCVRSVIDERLAACGTIAGDVFDDLAAIDELVALSGGHLRTLFLLMRTVIETSDLVAPLSADHVHRVAAELAEKYLDPLEPAQRAVVREVHDSQDKPPDDARLDTFYELLRNQYVFAYAVANKRWYDWNPMLGRSSLA